MSAVGFSFRPSFAGTITVDRVPDDFLERIEQRVIAGLLVPGRRQRANYRVVSRTTESLEFEAADFLTAYAIGLNRVTLRRTGRDTISYEVSFARWTGYAVTHGALLGVVLAIVFAASFQGRIQPLRAWWFWSIVAFWSLAWPWLLTAIHRPFAARALEAILREELDGETPRRAAS